MKDNQNLAKKSLVYSIGNLGTLLINFFLVPLYTFYLTQGDLGYFDIIASTLVLLTPTLFGHIELAVLRWLMSVHDEKMIKRVVSNALMVVFIGILFFSVFFFLVNYIFEIRWALYVYVYLLSNFLYIIFKQIIRAVYSPWHYVFTELIYVSIILLTILCFGQKYQLKAILLSYGFATLSLLIYLVISGFFNKIDLRLINLKTSKELLGYSLPLSLNAASLWLNNQSSKYLIVGFLNFGANGIYAVSFKFAYVIQILNRIFYMSFQDKMFAIYEENKLKSSQYFTETINKYLGLIFSFLTLLIGFQNLVIPLIIDAKYLESLKYIPILGLGVVFMSLSSLLGIVYQCEKRNIDAFKTSFVSGVLILVFGFFLIPEFKLMGAAVVFVLGNLAWLIYRYFDTKKYVNVRISFSRILAYTLISFLLYLLTFSDIWSIKYSIPIIALLLCGTYNYHLLKSFIQNLLNLRNKT